MPHEFQPLETLSVEHARSRLALHHLRTGNGPPLLLLHALGGRSRDWDVTACPWDGDVFALDFAGHGDSSDHVGGSYSCEMFAADADHALIALAERARTGPHTVHIAGRGVGGYVALLLAGARPDVVRGILILDGPGLEGGGAAPDFERPPTRWSALPDSRPAAGPDAAVLRSDSFLRPPDYAQSFAARARSVLISGEIGTESGPAWLQQVARADATRAAAPAMSEALRELAGA